MAKSELSVMNHDSQGLDSQSVLNHDSQCLDSPDLIKMEFRKSRPIQNGIKDISQFIFELQQRMHGAINQSNHFWMHTGFRHFWMVMLIILKELIVYKRTMC
jgi:hypothetical protein